MFLSCFPSLEQIPTPSDTSTFFMNMCILAGLWHLSVMMMLLQKHAISWLLSLCLWLISLTHTQIQTQTHLSLRCKYITQKLLRSWFSYKLVSLISKFLNFVLFWSIKIISIALQPNSSHKITQDSWDLSDSHNFVLQNFSLTVLFWWWWW